MKTSTKILLLFLLSIMPKAFGQQLVPNWSYMASSSTPLTEIKNYFLYKDGSDYIGVFEGVGKAPASLIFQTDWKNTSFIPFALHCKTKAKVRIREASNALRVGIYTPHQDAQNNLGSGEMAELQLTNAWQEIEMKTTGSPVTIVTKTCLSIKAMPVDASKKITLIVEIDWYKVVSFDGKVTTIDDFGDNTVAIEKENVIPSGFVLNQNYPNPFNPETKISFSIPESGNYTLKVYNLLSQEVAILVDGQLSAGIHDASYNAANLPSGVYVYRLTGKNVTLSKKMTLLK